MSLDDFQLMRYDKTTSINTRLDQISDMLNHFSLFKSQSYTEDLLIDRYGFKNKQEIHATYKLINDNVDNVIGFTHQGLSGPQELSYLPLYYSSLSLIRIYLLLNNERETVLKLRRHGATYNPQVINKNILNQEVVLHREGTIPSVLFSMTGQRIDSTYSFKVGEIFPYLSQVSAEYREVTGQESLLYNHKAIIVKDEKKGHYLEICPVNNEDIPDKTFLKAYSKLGIRPVNEGSHVFHSKRFKTSYTEAINSIKLGTRRFLMNDGYQDHHNRWTTTIPLSRKSILLNQELYIILLFCQLSNIVRYNPAHLKKLKDSKYWAIYSAFGRHCYLDLLILMWSNCQKKVFDLRSI